MQGFRVLGLRALGFRAFGFRVSGLGVRVLSCEGLGGFGLMGSRVGSFPGDGFSSDASGSTSPLRIIGIITLIWFSVWGHIKP